MIVEPDELAAWLRLLAAPLGRAAVRRLLAEHGSVEAAARAATADTDEAQAAGEAAQAWLAGGSGRGITALGDADYPPALLHTADPPLLLYLQGRPELLQRQAVAIVGSRNATPQGEDNARAFAAHLSRAGLTVISGLALGIDGAAHQGGLAGPGSTIAVVGTGLDRVYPSRHRALAHRIAEQGLLISEFPLGTPPIPGNFPSRNRIIAGLSLGTLVVEAALQSGSLITARLAAEMGREVFAIPGSIHSPQSRGCHALLKQGAKLVESGQDVLEELQLDTVASAPAPDTSEAATADDDDALLQALGHDPATLDALIDRTGVPAHELSARLLELELQGRIARLPGGLYQRRGTG